jgi:hypothetical protein
MGSRSTAAASTQEDAQGSRLPRKQWGPRGLRPGPHGHGRRGSLRGLPALRHVHEAAAADGISAALEAALGYAGEPVVVSTDDEAGLQNGDLAVARRLGLDDDDIAALASRENDTWLGSCRNFEHSPFAKAGSPCPVPFTGCLLCANAVITRRKLPALLALKRRLEADADLTDQHVWVERWGATYVRIEQIIDRYPADEVTAADAISLATDDAPLQIPALLGIAP